MNKLRLCEAVLGIAYGVICVVLIDPGGGLVCLTPLAPMDFV